MDNVEKKKSAVKKHIHSLYPCLKVCHFKKISTSRTSNGLGIGSLHVKTLLCRPSKNKKKIEYIKKGLDTADSAVISILCQFSISTALMYVRRAFNIKTYIRFL